MGLKPGYKQTELGVIPEEWEVYKLQEVCRESITYGIVQCGPHIRNGIPYIRVSDMDEQELDVTRMLRTSPFIAARFVRSTVTEGDLVYALRGKLGEVRQIRAELAGANLTQGTARLSPSDKINNGYFLWAMRNPLSIRQVELEAKGTTFREITLANLRHVKILVPHISEQRAIAEALSDADALIETLEQLLTKKRHLKQGTMQELLQPRAGWSSKKLLRIAPLQRGFDLPGRQLESGPYPVVYSNGILHHHKTFMVRGPGLVTGRSGTLGVVQFVEEDFWPHNTTLWVTDFEGNDPKFVYYLYAHIGLERFGTGSGVPTLNRNDVHDFSASIPGNLHEQIRIATILTDMDTVIAAQEAKLAKARQLKQAMMQGLLTGRIRLV